MSAVMETTLQDYLRRAHLFEHWLTIRKVVPDDLNSMDQLICTWFDELFFAGRPSSEGSKFLASMMHLWPSLKPQGGFPRAARALKGWRRLAPARARRPIPWLAACAMMGTLLYLGKDDLAFAILIAFVCYLRPGKLCGLRPEQIVARVRGAGPGAMQ